MFERLKTHMVDDWQQGHTFASNHAFAAIAVIGVVQQYGGDYIPPIAMAGVALAGIALRMWKQGPSPTTGDDQ